MHICCLYLHTFIGLPDSGESDFLDSKRPELSKLDQNDRFDSRKSDSPESGKPMNVPSGTPALIYIYIYIYIYTNIHTHIHMLCTFRNSSPYVVQVIFEEVVTK